MNLVTRDLNSHGEESWFKSCASASIGSAFTRTLASTPSQHEDKLRSERALEESGPWSGTTIQADTFRVKRSRSHLKTASVSSGYISEFLSTRLGREGARASWCDRSDDLTSAYIRTFSGVCFLIWSNLILIIRRDLVSV